MRPAVFLTTILLWWNGLLFASVQNHMDIPSENTTACRLTRQSDTGLVFVSTISGLGVSEISTNKGSFVSLDIPEYVNGPWESGFPQLPVVTMIIEIPQKAGVKAQVTDVEETLVSLEDLASGLSIAPRQPHRPKRITSDNPPFYYDETLYGRNQWIQPVQATVDILGTMRSSRLARLTLCPFRYNPVTNELGVAHHMTITVTFDSGDMALTRSIKAKYQTPEFEPPLARVANRLTSSPASKDVLINGSISYPLTYVVVSSKAFLESTAMTDFISWKTRSGFNVIQAETDSIYDSSTISNTRRTRLKDFLQDLYDNSATPPSYVLFVGDVHQIPPYRISDIVIEGSAYDDHYTDLYYCDFTGDYLPEAYYGRFPVHTEAELNHVISKTLAYETYSLTTPGYLDQAMVIAGADNYFSRTYANGQVAYLLNEYVNTDPANGFSDIYAFLFEPQFPDPWEVIDWTWDGTTIHKTGKIPVTGKIKNYIDSGVGLVNFTGHCDEYGWWNKLAGTYELDDDDIDALSDNAKYGFYVANCCESSRFELTDRVCFGTKLLLAEDKGAVAYLGAANYTFWDDDFYWAVGYKAIIEGMRNDAVHHLSYGDTDTGNFDTLWHSHDEPQSDWYTTAGQMVYSGNLAVDTVESDFYFDFGKYYWEIYNVIGDPSLTPYLSSPRDLPEPEHDPLVPCEDSAAYVQTVPGALVALSRDGELLSSSLADSAGRATLPLTPLDDDYTLDLLITKQGYIPQTGFLISETFPEDTLPQASFHYGTESTDQTFAVVFGRSVTFVNTSTGCPSEYLWTFDGADITTSAEKSPTVIFSQGIGTFEVTLTVTNINGNSEPLTQYVSVSPDVNFTITPEDIEPGGKAIFTPVTSPESTEWHWTFSGGYPESSKEQSPEVLFELAGNHQVTLSVTIEGETYGPVTKSAFVVNTTKADGIEADSKGGGCFISSF